MRLPSYVRATTRRIAGAGSCVSRPTRTSETRPSSTVFATAGGCIGVSREPAGVRLPALPLPSAVVLSLATVAGSAAVASPSAPAGSRIIDRTVECRLPAGLGYPDPAPVYVNVSAVPRQGDWPPRVSVGSNKLNVGFGGFSTGRSPQHPTGALWINRNECKPSTRRVLMTTAGLRGGRTQFGARHRCEVPTRLLVRVRALFTRPVTLLRRGEEFIARGTVTSGSVIVRTVRGAPIFHGSAAHRAGSASSLVATQRCATGGA
jgi:hypothetical protein